MNRTISTMLAVVIMTAGCSRSDNTATTGGPGGVRAPLAAGADAVAAALQSNGVPIAKVAFALTAVPVQGQPLDMRLDISASAPTPAVQLIAEGDGIAIDPGTARASLSLQTAGATVSHHLNLVPQREGLTEITLRLTDGRADSPETTYAIPVLVPKAATGQAAPRG